MIRLEDNLSRLDDISKLEKNWNGYNAEPIDKSVIEITKFILNQLPVQPEMYPTGRETIQLQYELKDNTYVEFEIYPNEIRCMAVPKRIYDNATWYKLNTCNLIKTLEDIRWILKVYRII